MNLRAGLNQLRLNEAPRGVRLVKKNGKLSAIGVIGGTDAVARRSFRTGRRRNTNGLNVERTPVDNRVVGRGKGPR